MLTATYPFNHIKHNRNISEFILILCYSLMNCKFNVITRVLIINMYSEKTEMYTDFFLLSLLFITLQITYC